MTDNKRRNGREAFSAKSPRQRVLECPGTCQGRLVSERSDAHETRVCDSKGTASVVFAGGRPPRSPPLLAQRSLRRGARCLVTPDFVIPLAHQGALLLPAQRVPVGIVGARVVHLRAIEIDLLAVRPDHLLKL